MKKTITVLCLAVLAGAAAGQYPMYNRLPLDTATIAPKCDTIPIIYLYCDTTEYDSWIRINEKNVYWDFGYEVKQETGIIPITSSENNMMLNWVMQYRHISYLDRHKQPIRKSIVIFMTKTIEK